MNLPQGNYALSLAHPGHELLLHGFLEQAKPFTFIMTDGANPSNNNSSLFSYARYCIETTTTQGINLKVNEMLSDKWKRLFLVSNKENHKEKQITEEQIYNEIIQGSVGFFAFYINFLATNFIKFNIDYVIMDPREGYSVLHDICSIVTSIAVKVVKKHTDKKIKKYEYAIFNKYENIGDDCIHIELDDEAVKRKIKAIINYHPAGYKELSVLLGEELIEQIKVNDKAIVKELFENTDKEIFRYENLCPCRTEYPQPPYYELNGEKFVSDGIYPSVITYSGHIKPIKEKLTALYSQHI